MRLRPLTEAECYARCYGARDERVSLLTKDERPPSVVASRLREVVERRLEERLDSPARDSR